MNTRRCYLLLEVLVGLALLAGLGVWLLTLQSAALRQYHAAQRRAKAARQVQALLWQWSSAQTPITLPAGDRFDETLSWRRQARPVRVAQDVLPTLISLIVTENTPHAQPREIYRVDWLVPRPADRGRRP